MLLYFFALTGAAIVLLAGNPRGEVNRWAAAFLALAAIGGLTDVLRDAGWTQAARAVQYANLVLTPYAVAVFALVYSLPAASPARIRLWKWLLLIPPASMLGTTLAFGQGIDYGWLLAWAAPCYAGACFLLVAALLKENNRVKRRNRLMTTLIMVPSLLAVLFLIYAAKLIAPDFDFFRYVSLFFVYSFAVAALSLFVYGVLGIKLRVERDPMESAMQAASSGTHLLAHSIKNEIGKIAIGAENAKRSLSGADEAAREHLALIESASAHLLAMAERVHGRTKRIELRPEPCRLDLLAEAAAARNRERADRNRIDLVCDFSVRPTLLCDPLHVAEALENVLSNAIEALPGGGTIVIGLAQNRNGVSLSVEDNGIGIPKDLLGRVFEPFYSSKSRDGNFGLGLSYAYNVMRDSKGSVELSSRVNEGTRVTMHFPASAVLNSLNGGDL
ncbi:sensor histidine kinase [Cohnella algarum]|uniref:sensor histidine kinase n=1 Tax=Cohnella algarum TaxID=2044859 RepID=UPI0019685546|nr:HAMP domain-containing sensor histidine kinase [Cohnella algarum]MBN2980173.1 HAMP domain-containing histidine kinase [Cohnella algarum]